MEHSYQKIGEFAKRIGKHANTVDGWFRTLESERRLHYITRVNNEKVYDELDFKIAQYIKNKRDEKWSLDGIYDSLPDRFTLRPFPSDFEEETKSVQVVDIDKMRATLMNEMKSAFEEVAATHMEKQMQDFQNMLPSREQQRVDRLNSIMAERKVTRKLEEEALSIWFQKPVEDRLIKAGWFRREEDKEKRDRFIRDYVDKHFEDALKREFGIDQEDDM